MAISEDKAPSDDSIENTSQILEKFIMTLDRDFKIVENSAYRAYRGTNNGCRISLVVFKR